MNSSSATSGRDVLVAVVDNEPDFTRARDGHWYRIPVEKAASWRAKCWPPRWLAFYHTEAFEREAHSVTYFANVENIREVRRSELFPDDPPDGRSENLYHQLLLGPLRRLPHPILSRRRRWIAFIPTTQDKLCNAREINDLYDDSPLENRLWEVLKRLNIPAERQEQIEIESQKSFLDFAVYCVDGNLDVETDGKTWHGKPENEMRDARRDKALAQQKWSVLRFSTERVENQLMEHCIPKIVDKINELGGIKEIGLPPRRIELPDGVGFRQRGLFGN